jgi:hypothetical protein
MICAAIQGLPSRDTLALINQNKDSIHDLNKAVTHESLNNCTPLYKMAGVHEASRQAKQDWKFSV